MADEPAQSVAPEAEVPAVAPVEAAPIEAAAPAEVSSEPAPSLLEGAAEAEAAPAEAPAEEPVAEPAAAEAPAEPEKPEADAKPGEAAQAAPEPAPFVYAEFKLPEGVTAPAEDVKAFTDLLGTVDVRTQEGAQALMDMHTAALQKQQAAMDQRQRDVFAQTQAQWVADFERQAGNQRDTILSRAKAVITDTVKDEAARKELWGVLAYTGAGNHPAVINALAAMHKRLAEAAKPPAALPTAAQPTRAADRRYGPQT